jgi:hypothetical protein
MLTVTTLEGVLMRQLWKVHAPLTAVSLLMLVVLAA